MLVTLFFLKRKPIWPERVLATLAGAADDFVPLEFGFIDGEAEGGGVVGDFVEEFGIVDEGFGGDAAPVEADAAEFGFFDAGDGFAELGGMDGGFVTAGAGADDDKIKRLIGHFVLLE